MWGRCGDPSEPRLYALQPAHQWSVARLRPTGKADNVQVLWWRREIWAPPGDFGSLILPLDKALDFVATEGFFWINA